MTPTVFTAEAATIIGCPSREVRRMLGRGELQGYKDDTGRWIIDLGSVTEMAVKYDTSMGPAMDTATLEAIERAYVAGFEEGSADRPLSDMLFGFSLASVLGGAIIGAAGITALHGYIL